MAKILDGKLVAQAIKNEVKGYVDACPGDICLTIFQVGDNPASNTYIKNKCKACEEVGIKSLVKKVPVDYNQERLANDLDFESRISDGVMLQLPLPDGFDEHGLLNSINPRSDADCLATCSLGEFYASNKPEIAPCTAQGIIDMLDYYSIPIEGKRALVIGRSNIVGKPIAHLLTARNATVAIAHSRTPKSDLLRLFATADIVVSATGKINVIDEEDADQYSKDYRHDFYGTFGTKMDRVIIDVGINRDENGKLCGDFSEEFKAKYSAAYSPVPGGCGVVTVAELLKNTIKLHNNNTK